MCACVFWMHLECECRAAHRWGEHGRLAHGDVVGTRPAPGAVHTADSAGFAMVAAGENHTLALSDAGDLFAAGHGLDGAAAGAQQGIVRCLLGDAAAAASCVGVAAAAACCCCCCCWCSEFLLLSLSLSSRNTDLRAGLRAGALGCGAPLRATMLRRVALPINAAVSAIAAGYTTSFAVMGALTCCCC